VHRCRYSVQVCCWVRVKESSSFIVLGRGVNWLKHDASSLRIIYPHDRYVRVAFHLSHLVSWCVYRKLVSSASFGLTETSPTKSSSKLIICCGLSCSMEGRVVRVTCCITSMSSFALTILLFLLQLPYFIGMP
jgi:hypothetical protein